MIFEEFIPNNKTAFLAKVAEVCQKLGIKPEWLMAVMWSESRLRPDAYNSNGGATGLIQFMPSTATGMGTTTAALKQMNNLAQLDYVYRYFKGASGKMKSFTDLYLFTFFPVAVGKPDTFVLETKYLAAGTIAKANPGFDLNKDKIITVGEFKQAIVQRLPKEIQDMLKKKLF